MYRKHFGFTRHPFSKEIASEELFQSAANREIDARLNHLKFDTLSDLSPLLSVRYV